MPLPDQTPKLPKLPFLIGDAALLAVAWYIAAEAPQPLPMEQALIIAGCVAGAGLIGVIPFLTDYARRQDEALDDRQRGLEALARTVASSAEQISIAAQGLQEITVLAQKNLQDSEHLPRKLQEKLAEIQPRADSGRGAEKQKADKELSAALSAKTERLEAVAEQIARGAADWAKADNAFQKLVATLEKFSGRPGKGPKAEAPPPKPEEPAPAEPAPAPPPPAAAEEKAPEAPKWESEPEPLPAPPPAEPPAEAAVGPTLALDLPPPVVVPKAPRKPRKPKVESPPEAPAPEAAPAAAPGESSQVAPDEAAPAAAVSSDGATRLLVTAYIGIGNRLFIRGDGPGLTWEKGVPLQFVSIGKWRWETADAAAPVKFKLYKNDELECAGLGEGTLEAGRQQELTAAF